MQGAVGLICAVLVAAAPLGGCAAPNDAAVQGCEGARLRANPGDAGAPGPWTVGAAAVEVAGLQVEVWYPAAPDSVGGAAPVVYDVRDALPEAEAVKVSDAANPIQSCDCYRDLPLDVDFGPYPVVLFVHGTASFRSQSLPHMVHWASRGFVVLAADHPGLALADYLNAACGGEVRPQDLGADLDALLAATRGEIPGLEAFVDHVDSDRVALAGHSAGGRAIATLADRARVLIPMAAGGVEPGGALRSTLILGGTADSVVPYEQQVEGFEASPPPKRLVGIEGAGHLAFTEICALRNAASEGLFEVAVDVGICGAELAGVLFQCSDELTPDPSSWAIIDHVTSSVLEAELHCAPDRARGFDDLQQRFGLVADYRVEP